MKILKVLLGIGAAIGLMAIATQPSGAADVPYYKGPNQANVFSWNGAYVGIATGYAVGDINFSGPAAFSVEPRGFTIGGVLGYNWQLSRNWVFGVEADLDWTNIDRTTNIGPVGINSGLDYMATVRGRLGYSFGTWMVYAHGGWAGGHLATNVGIANLSADDFVTGWVYGAGVEMALSRDWSLDFNWRRMDLSGTQNFGPAALNADPEIDIYKVALKWRFAN